jgi:radical SAM superfamily enzyme YgiQ (UPF0313 family)
MSKLALINPSNKFSYSGAPPISLALLASYIKQFNHQVKIVDMASGDNLSQIDEFKPDLVGITGTTLTINTAYLCADLARKKGYKVVIGGIHASILPEEAIKHADAVVIGEGEIILKKIIDENLTGIIKGIPIENLDELPLPAYDLLNMEFYVSVKPKILRCIPENSRTGNILTSRGCPYSCTFCHNSFKGLKFRYNSAEKVIEEIEYLIKHHQIDSLFFIEDNFFVMKDRVKKICELIIERKIRIRWGGNSRVDNLDKNLLILAKEAGCVQITFGWESGSQRMLDIYNKRTTILQNEESIKLCNEIGIFPNGTFMIGGPDETIEDIRLTKEFIKNNRITGGIGVCITTPFPGTKMWNDLKEQGRIPEKINYEDFNFLFSPFKICDIDNQTLVDISNKLKDLEAYKQYQYQIEEQLKRCDF